MFFGDKVQIARYDKQTYPVFEKLRRQQVAYGWTPDEVNMSKDKSDFRNLSDAGQHIFKSTISRQIVLDTEQGVSPSLAFLPVASLPEVENWIQAWAYSETIHSWSYTHILRGLDADPAEVFDNILSIKKIVECKKDIAKYYDNLRRLNASSVVFDGPQARLRYEAYNEYEHKKALWLAMVSANVLEGIRFYSSFACSWAFAEQKLMEGNAKVIKFIARDENLHLAGTQHFLKLLPKDDPDFVQIQKDCQQEVVDMFEQCVEQEKDWSEYLFQHGSILGLNHEMLVAKIEWLANKRMNALGISNHYKGGSNPLPWDQKWIAGSDVQVAPQETEISSYILGGVKKDVNADTFKGFSL
jgi:ribonucleoside-diphosphate reductase beta chain